MNARSSSLKTWRANFSSSRSARRRVSKRSCSARMPEWYAGDVSSFITLLLRKGHRLRRLGVDMQLEQVRPRVVADDVEVAPRHRDPLRPARLRRSRLPPWRASPRGRGTPASVERSRRATWPELARRYLRA